ncbi:hypothetical protein [Zobellia barbeyronii]|uniref:Uncharacterized protein n=1 Tax=Zobellia barbeyronii TaxID=2748009 RepID=A0ABS5WHJ5_9FLAO|nr:hypothetical protein [Zobellia barbeyronii]MBT2162732.1 hypothetical protein [Zobellia barbeyronii]
MKILVGILCFTIIYGCGCSDDETINYNLNEFESSAMSTIAQDNIQFINNEQEMQTAKVTVKITENRSLNSSDDDSCVVVLAESQENELIFEDLGRTFTTIIEKRDENKSHIVVADGPGFYGIDSLNTENLEEALADFSSDGYEFNNVFVLNSGSHSGFIIYSPLIGIQFIKNDDGSYLKRME